MYYCFACCKGIFSYFCKYETTFAHCIHAFFVIISCDRYSKYESLLYPIDRISASRPDSALRLLNALQGKMASAPERVRAYYEMMRTKNMVNSGVKFTSDSIIRSVADYYDRHGDNNHRLLSKCLLGCVELRMGKTSDALLVLNRLPDVLIRRQKIVTTGCWDRFTHCWRTHILKPCCHATCLRRRASVTVTP